LDHLIVEGVFARHPGLKMVMLKVVHLAAAVSVAAAQVSGAASAWRRRG